MKIFSIGPQEVHKPDPGPEKKFPQMLQNSIRSKLDGPIKFTIFQGHIWFFTYLQKVTRTTTK